MKRWSVLYKHPMPTKDRNSESNSFSAIGDGVRDQAWEPRGKKRAAAI